MSFRRFWPSLVLLLVALNLRPSVTSLGPVLPDLIAEARLTALGASLLATAPVLCLGLFAATAPALMRRLGLEWTVVAVLAAIALGSGVRALGAFPALLIGGVLAGAGVGIGNVVMPGLIKQDFSNHAAPMTGLYTMGLCLGAAAGSGLTAPLRHAAGDSAVAALALWGVPALVAGAVAAMAWRGRVPPWRRWARGRGAIGGPPRGNLLAEPLAWQVTLFLGLQSIIGWAILGWLAPVLRDRGDDPVTAGLVVALAVGGQVGSALPAPILAARLRRQGGPAAIAMATIMVGLLGLLWAPLWWQWACAIVLGLGMGAGLSLAMMIIILRAPDAAVAGRLSGMAQSIAYSLAALGPLIVGVTHDATGDWRGMAKLCVLCCAGASVAGGLAGRDRMLRPRASVSTRAAAAPDAAP